MAWYYYAGGAAALAGLALIIKGGSGAATSESSDGGAPVGTPMATPLFMASGGGTSQAATNDLPLGGEAWKPYTVPLSENPDVAIAKMNADVNLAAINASTQLQLAAINQTQTPNETGNKTEYRGNNIAEGAAYVKSMLDQIPAQGNAAVEQAIYNKAKQFGYSPTEVAQSFTAATGAVTTPAQINKWLSDRGLSL